jgi:ectoine hydroxylase-related dioxygenase (phytanoyl-CoA dioxygenase family)
MKTFEPAIGSDAVRFFVDNGYLVVTHLVGEDEVAELRADTARFARGDYPVINAWNAPEPGGDDQAGGAILAVHFPHWVSPIMRRMIAHPGVAGVVQRIAAAHLPYWDGSVKCMQSMLFLKPPGLQGQAWHQDERYIPTRDRSLVGAWIALDDATEENGCLHVLPASQRAGYLWPTRPHGLPEEFDFADESYGFDEKPELAVEVEAGTAVFFNGYLLHRSHRNRGTRMRRALVNHYCNAYSLLPWFVPPRDVKSIEIGTLDNRAVVPVGTDPYAWKGYADEPQWVFLRRYAAGK